ADGRARPELGGVGRRDADPADSDARAGPAAARSAAAPSVTRPGSAAASGARSSRAGRAASRHAPARSRSGEPVELPPATRYLEPLPESPARLNRQGGDAGAYLAVIKVVGVGGAGINAVNRMIDAGISQVEFIAVNTDMQALHTSDAPVKIHIGRELTQGLGSGSDPDVGRRAADESYDELKQELRGADMVFVAAGEGG